ncbi:amidohydrolase family protein [Roseimaritima ulvae]|uniref:Translocation protein TolB n=1 Tax=Roseimaritima ulvae TaxID=980254 RepID=A0A5B9R0T6_9BACT|nr:amidohydrolase family protein [Roseimaritima ulvae]QEG39831.1 translocation protein TolB [Roseimaritima ulvae]
MLHRLNAALLLFAVLAATDALADAPAKSWKVASPPGPSKAQPIDVDEGTWLNLDVSPDGQTIVFDLLGDLYLMPIEGADGSKATSGRKPKKLTSGVAWDMQPRFSPDGQTIAFTSDRTGKNDKGGDNIWRIDVDGKNLTQVTSETYRLLNGPAWSPDGQYIVARKHFTSRRSLGSGEMWMYHRDALATDATAGIQLTEKPNAQKDVNEPIFSPDGRYLYYSQDATPGNTFEYDKDSHKGIYVVKRLDLQTSETETLISGPGGACRPVPSPDGSTIAFVRRVGAKTGLHLYDLRSGGVRVLYEDLERDMQEAWAIHGVYSSYAWTPDGEAIVIWAKGKIRRIQVADGSAQVIPFRIRDQRSIRKAVRFPIPVAEDNFNVKMLRSVTTAPDGSMVAYQALGHVYVRNLPSGQPRRLTTQSDHFEFFPSFSRDGRYIAYCSWHDQSLGAVRIAAVDPQAAENWIVTTEPGHYTNPVFSPDGETVVYEKHAGGYLTSHLWSRDTGLYRSSARGGDMQRIAKSASSPQFAAANDRVFFTKSEGGSDADNRKLCSIQLDGTDQRTHYTSQWATDFRVSPDRKHVAFVERFHVYVAPMIDAGSPISVGPGGKALPIRKVSETAGDFVHFSGDGKRLHWSLGPDYYSIDVTPEADEPTPPEPIAIGFQHPHDKPEGKVAIVGAKIVTMGKAGVIDRGVILLEGNRITAVGPMNKIKVPEDAFVIQAKGQVVTPGLIDTHAHGPMAASGITPQQNWVSMARLAFGVTTIHDPSNDTHSIFAASELTKAGKITAPRTFSTGKILYGATGSFKAEINSLEDAKFHLQRMKAVGAFSVKSYNQPRRDQRQQVIAAARELKMMVVPEGGSTFMHNMTMIVDGHTGIEHTLPVQTAYDDVMDLWRNTGVGYTPTLNVAYGGLSGEQYWYATNDLWLHPRLQTFIPPHVLNPRSRRRQKSPLEDYNHIRVAEIAKQVVDQGGLVQSGGHGQLAGICTHWELWSFVQGGMTPMQALACGTINGAKYLGLDGDLGSIEKGKLADLVILQKGADPTVKIRDTEKIATVIANGRIYEANRMNRYGSRMPRTPFYWNDGAGSPSQGFTLSDAVGCSCGRCAP